MSKPIPKPKYKPWNVIVGRCHPDTETIMFEIIDARRDNKYFQWVYRGIHKGKEKEMWEGDVLYAFKD